MSPEEWLARRWASVGDPVGPGVERVRDRLGPPNGHLFIRKEARDASERRALLREAGLLARFEHRALRRLVGVADGPARSVAVLEHVDGIDLGAHLAARPDDASRCAVSLLRALVYLHGRSRVHGDLKPANVLVTASGQLRLIDLGLVVPVGAQPLGGTGYFLPPEYDDGASASVSGDLYSFGRTLEDAGASNIVAHWPQALRDAVAACTQQRPERRPASAEALLARLGETPHPLDRTGELPRRATDHALETAATALDRKHGETVVVLAPAGSGRTRFARELSRRALGQREAVAELTIGSASGHDALAGLAALFEALDGADAIARAAHERIAMIVELEDDDHDYDHDHGDVGDALSALAEGARRIRSEALGSLVIVGAPPQSAELFRAAEALVVEVLALDRGTVEAVLRDAGARADERLVDAIVEASAGLPGRVARAAIALSERPDLPLDEVVAIAGGRRRDAGDSTPGAATSDGPQVDDASALRDARAALDAREHERAVGIVTGAWPGLADDPHRSIEAAEVLARAHAAAGRVAEAAAIAARLGGRASASLRLDRARWLERLGRYGDAREAAAGLLRDADPAMRAAAAVVAAQAALATGDSAAAEQAARRGLDDVPAGDPTRVRLLALRSDVALLRSDNAAALTHASAALAVARELGDRRTNAQSLSRLASVLALGGDPVRARERHAEALAEAEEANDVAGLSTYVMNLATAEHALGEIGAAVARYEEAARLARRHGRDAVLAASLANLGGLLAWAGADDEAESVLAEANGAAARCGASVYEGQVALIRAEIGGRRDAVEGRRLAERARSVFEKANATRQELEAELLAAELGIAAGDPRGASALLSRARKDLESAGLGARACLADALAGLAEDDIERARRMAEQAVRRAQHDGDRELEARALDGLSRVHDRLHTGAAGAYRERARIALGDAAARLPSGLRERFLAVAARAAIVAATERETAAGRPRGLDDRARRLLALVRRLLLEGDESKLLEAAVDEAVALTHAERAFLLTRRPGGASEVAVARNLDRETIRRSRFRFSRSVAERVLSTAEPFIAARATDDPELRGAKSVMDLGLRSIICVPVRGPTVLAGALYLDHRFEAARFDEVDLEMVQALADIVGVALENARLHREAARHAEELERAHTMVLRENAERAAEVDRLVEALANAGPAAASEPDEEGGIVGRSASLRRALGVVRRVAPSDLPVLIEGESGTGKELVARYLHTRSGRARGPFVAVNCGALPETLLESELFGHVRGAFTGAVRDNPGVFRVASGGTLLLDEIGEMPLRMQTRLLRVLQEGEIRPVGGGHPVKVDVRVVAATHRDLERDVESGRFRRDLFYRLVGVRIALPPLRDRRDDIPLLAKRALERIAREPGMRPVGLSRGALSLLVAHDWPGNVRELEQTLRRAVLVADGDELLAADLGIAGTGATRRDTLAKVDRGLLEQALRVASGNRSAAARALGISRVTLHRWMKRYAVA